MTGWMLPLAEGLAIALVIALLSLIRHEGLPVQIGVELVVLSLLATAFSLSTGLPLQPVLLLIVLYLIVMRARLLVDLGNFFSGRGQFRLAETLYLLALQVWPDPFGRVGAMINLAVNHMRQRQWANAIDILTAVLETRPGGAPSKLEAACRFNLGVAYERQGRPGMALQQYQAVTELLPNSLYARHASAAIKRGGKPADSQDAST
jgi:tetratricopeptide (TPR) repeat protein